MTTEDRRQFLLRYVSSIALATRWVSAAAKVGPPAPFGPTPSTRQLRWHEMEFYGFIHFTINTFTDKEWGYGDESPSLFNPTDFDAEQIASTAAAAGMKGLILTCKHHDGFCLWPSKHTEHSVKNSPWRNGRRLANRREPAVANPDEENTLTVADNLGRVIVIDLRRNCSIRNFRL